ncbi:MAG: exodeoxyribonuclease VII small subunit [Deltaproteobacteria bacterium]|jgi:exodeoxyribonuclease VII small subunit|nr:exodeoxyribonuclease VII small subunit [Deltaproteobacteria bacterium]MBW2534317.1 exodeoxyribonuclease VII small subunit [Deltaproteobacteria bacterium]
MGRTRTSSRSQREPQEGAAAGDESKQAAENEPSFEASAERLAAIVEQLEGGEQSLESSLKLFEEGVQVARAAQRRLDEAERRVDELLGVEEGGQAVTRELER